MNLIKRFFSGYINRHIHVSLSVVALCGITALEFHLNISCLFYLLIFTGSIIGYNFITGVGKRGKRFTGRKGLSLLLLIVISGFILFKVSFLILVSLLLLGMLTVLYALPVAGRRNLRSVAGIKVFLVALVWAGVTAILPLEFAEIKAVRTEFVFTFLQRFLIVLLLLVPFEIRDFQKDLPELHTWPQEYGIAKTKFAAGIGAVIVFTLEWLKPTIDIDHFTSLVIFLILLCFGIVGAKEIQRKYYSSFWIEGLPLLWWLLFFLFRKL